MKFLINVDILEHYIEEDKFCDVFIPLFKKNIGILLDEENFIINQYENLLKSYIDDDDTNAAYFMKKWINNIVNGDKFEKYALEYKGLCPFEHSVLYIKDKIYKNVITLNEFNYSKYRDDIKDENIFILDKYTVTESFVNQLESIRFTQNSNKIFFQDNLFQSILTALIEMMNRKHMTVLEDIHNSFITGILNINGYYRASDQTQAGTSTNGFSAGELDILIKELNNRPLSIIEAFRLDSFNVKNTVIDTHIDKLINKYDTTGLETNYIIVYSENKNFEASWKKYNIYLNDLNNKVNFDDSTYPLYEFTDYSDDAAPNVGNIKVGLAKHMNASNNNKTNKIIHIFVNFHVPKSKVYECDYSI